MPTFILLEGSLASTMKVSVILDFNISRKPIALLTSILSTAYEHSLSKYYERVLKVTRPSWLWILSICS